MSQSTSKPYNYTSSPQGTNVLGRTRGQRTAEVMAGLRAEFDPSPETKALASLGGRVTARLLLALLKDTRRMVGYVILRDPVMYELLRREKLQDPRLLVDAAAGFSVLGLRMAKDVPGAQVVEVDLPDVIKAKQDRLKRSYPYELPANLRWQTADLAVTPMIEVLDGQQADAITSAGLLAYFPPEEVVKLTDQMHRALKPGGLFITDVMWTRHTTEAESSRSAVNAFRRQAADFKSMVRDESELAAMFPSFASVEAHLVTKVTASMGINHPAVDYGFIVVARR